MSNQIILKKSSVAAKVPLSTDLAFGELALNYADGVLYYKNSAGTIASISGGGGGGGGAVALAGETFSTSNSLTATGSSQVTSTALTNDYNIITTAIAGSGVSLPVPTAGRRIKIVNRSTFTINVYPSTSTAIDGYAVNIPITVPSFGWMEFNAASTTLWYSSFSATIASIYTSSSASSAYNAYSRNTTFTATGGETSISTTYTVGNIQVYKNGVLLTNGGSSPDYAATTGSSVTFTTALIANDEIDIIKFTPASPIGISIAMATQLFLH